MGNPRDAVWNAVREVVQAVVAIFAAIASIGWSKFKEWVVSKWQKDLAGEHQQDGNQPDELHQRRKWWNRLRRRR